MKITYSAVKLDFAFESFDSLERALEAMEICVVEESVTTRKYYDCNRDALEYKIHSKISSGPLPLIGNYAVKKIFTSLSRYEHAEWGYHGEYVKNVNIFDKIHMNFVDISDCKIYYAQPNESFGTGISGVIEAIRYLHTMSINSPTNFYKIYKENEKLKQEINKLNEKVKYLSEIKETA